MKTELESFKDKIFFKNGKKDKHYTFQDLSRKGNLYQTDKIWYEGLSEWTKVSEITELKNIALSMPPLTDKEKNCKILKKAFVPSLIFYTLFSLLIGITAGLIEDYKYREFFKVVNGISEQHQINEEQEKAKFARDFPEFSNIKAQENDNPAFYGYSNMKYDEVGIWSKDGVYYTRWKSYLPSRGTDQESISYSKHHKLLFRPYRALVKYANLSREERADISVLLLNFCFSAFVTNLLIFPVIMAVNFYRVKRRNNK